jgi:Cu/Ag efflux pump CusA
VVLEQTAYLRTVQDWIIRPQIKTVPGVAGVDGIGGFETPGTVLIWGRMIQSCTVRR